MYLSVVFVLLHSAAAASLASEHSLHSSKGLIRRAIPAQGMASVDEVHAATMALAMDEKLKLWWALTKDLDSGGGFPGKSSGSPWKVHEGPNASPLRVGVDLFTTHAAKDLLATGLTGQVCGETGDGHYLKGFFSKMCKSILVMDKFDGRADVKLDLNLPPAMAPQEVKTAQGTFNLVLSHQVFEHLLHPTTAIANLNAMLSQQGQLIFSTPFANKDHPSPVDYFRYTVHNIHDLLKCAGFEVHTLRGFGDRLASIANLAGITADQLPDSSRVAFCDGLKTKDCSDTYYTAVAAVAFKTKDVTIEEIRECYG